MQTTAPFDPTRSRWEKTLRAGFEELTLQPVSVHFKMPKQAAHGETCPVLYFLTHRLHTLQFLKSGRVLVPWKEGSVMVERLRFVARLPEGEKMSFLDWKLTVVPNEAENPDEGHLTRAFVL